LADGTKVVIFFLSNGGRIVFVQGILRRS